MTQNLYKPRSSALKAEDENLFSGVWLRWSALNNAERLVCANIVLLPVWWAMGLLSYLPELTMLGIAIYEWRRYGRLRLKYPSLVVIALFAYYAYGYIGTLLFTLDAYPFVELPPDAVIEPLDFVKSAFSFAFPCLVWYVQSTNVRVRLEVVAWACSVSVVQMLLFWLVVQFLFTGAYNHPPRSLYGILTGKNIGYVPGSGKGNYLIFYEEGRFQFFFNHYQSCAAFLGFVGLLALDIKNRFWSLLLLVGCFFLMILVASRSVWLAFPVAVFIRFLFTTGKVGGSWLLFALIAIVSFVTLSLSPVTDLIVNTYTGTKTAVGDYRQGSTQARAEVYQETLARIPDKLLFGHKVEGPATSNDNAGGEGPAVGSHSFILGGLLYKGGLVAAGFFVTFWASLIMWLYNTRVGRPMSWLPVMLLFSLLLAVTELQFTITMGIVVCMILRRPAIKYFRRSAS